jgi:hypothetical protein
MVDSYVIRRFEAVHIWSSRISHVIKFTKIYLIFSIELALFRIIDIFLIDLLKIVAFIYK